MLNNKLLLKIRNAYGKPGFSSDDLRSVASYWRRLPEADQKNRIDSLTWNDLSMDELFMRLNQTQTSVGSEFFYSMLHQLNFHPEELDRFEKKVSLFQEHDRLRESVQLILAKTGKCDDNGAADLFFSPKAHRLKYGLLYPILACLPIASAAVALVNLQLAIPLLLASFFCNMFVYYTHKKMIEKDFVSIRYAASIISCCKKLSQLKDPLFQDEALHLSRLFTPLKKIMRKAAGLYSMAGSDFEFLFEYIKLIFMVDFLTYNKTIEIFVKHAEDFHKLWKAVGELDTALAVASYRASLDYYVKPVFVGDPTVEAEDVYHPLLGSYVPNPVHLSINAIVTGSNASGKSTYVKAIAVNAIFAQTIHTCLATSFSMKPAMVYTSMAVEDSISTGESYFIAEIKSLKRILDALKEERFCLCFIDEILKGTNTVERIAASASILNFLCSRNCRCVVASHDIELTQILRDTYINLHFQETVTKEGVRFDYLLHKGASTTRNAIRLLEYFKYPASVIEEADQKAEHFTREHSWDLPAEH